MNYKGAMDYVELLGDYGIVPGQDSIRELCRRLGNPQEDLAYIHIAGTNGKGSVLAYLSGILKSAGYLTGSFSSPAVFEYREGIRVGGRPITQAAVCEGLEKIRTVCQEMVEEGLAHPTAYEVETALGFWYFKQKKCDIVVLETGMGGKEDATNIVRNTLVAIITPISLEHTGFLGKTLPEIAEHKAGIIKNMCYVISAEQEEEVEELLEKRAKEAGSPFSVIDKGRAKRIRYGIEKQKFDYDSMTNLEIPLAGKYQIENALIAIEAVKVLRDRGFLVKEGDIRKGLRETVWPGRFMVIGKKPLFIADGAHNPAAARELAASLEMYFTNRRIIYIMGMLRDKDYEKIIQATSRYAEQIITITPPNNKRALPAFELAKEIAKVHNGVTAVDSLEEAVEMGYLLASAEDVIVAFGSLSYLGRLIRIVEKKKKPSGKATGNRNGRL